MSKKKYDLDRKPLDSTAKIWAQRIRLILIERDMTQAELADLSGVSTGTLTNWIKDGKEPKIESLVRVAKALNVSVDYLAGLSEIEEPDIKYKVGSREFGLSSKSMKLLEAIKNKNTILKWKDELVYIGNKAISPKLISFILESFLEDENFWSGFDGLLSSYIHAENESKNKRTHPSEISEADAARYSLNRLFDKLIDDIYKSFYESKSSPKPLF